MTTTATAPTTAVDRRSRWGPFAVVAMAAPVVEALASGLHPEMPTDYNDLIPLVGGTERWYAMSLVGVAACACSLVAFTWLARVAKAGAPRLATTGLVIASGAAILMSAMQGFKLFLPTLADVAPGPGAEAVGTFIGGSSFTPMIAAFVLRAIGWAVLAVAVGRSGAAPWWASALIVAGVVVAFVLPAGPDALAWLTVAIGTGYVVGTHVRRPADADPR